MTSLGKLPEFPAESEASIRILGVSFCVAMVIEGLMLFALIEKMSAVRPPLIDSTPPIEAVIFEPPPEAKKHLTEEKPVAKPVAEQVLSKRVDVGRVAPKVETPESNQTESAVPAQSTHGPVVVSSVMPKIPTYLRNADLKANVLIEFVVAEDGSATPHLLGSSGNEELDAIALKSASQWKFSPALQAGKPVAAKVRLRIVFEVN